MFATIREAYGIERDDSLKLRDYPTLTRVVEFVRYHRFDARAQVPQQEERYVAYLVPSHGPPRWVPLGETAPIDAAVDAALAALQASPRTETARTALQQLDALVMTPLRDQLTGVSHLILAPDGKLNLGFTNSARTTPVG